MKSQFIVGLILLIIAGFFAKYKIFDDKLELRFSLTEKIPSEFIDNVDESGIQQLTIKNNGDILITSIIIKINASIDDVKIIKFKSSDEYILSKSNNYLEIEYPELPPSGEIIVLLKSIGVGISKNNIEIYHGKGVAKEVFTDTKSYGNVIFLIIAFIYIVLMVLGLKNSLAELLNIKARTTPIKILKQKKPWYLDESNWLNIRKNAVNNYFDFDYATTIEKCKPFLFLNSTKKDFFSDDEWKVLLNKAEEKFKTKISEKVYNSYYESVFAELSNLKKPISISFDTWEKINKEVSKAYCIHNIRDNLLYGKYSVEEFLSSKKPDIVKKDDWDNLRKVLLTYHASNLVEKGVRMLNYEDNTDKLNLDNLDTSTKKEIERLFQRIKQGLELEKNYQKMLKLFNELFYSDKLSDKPDFIDLKEWENIENYFRLKEEGCELKKYNEHMLKVLNDMFYWKELPSKPDKIELEHWENIKDIYIRVVEKEKESVQNLSNSIKLKTEFFPLKEKVTMQLAIIENLLNDPMSIEKVEMYNNPFATGNWDNLKEISKILISK